MEVLARIIWLALLMTSLSICLYLTNSDNKKLLAIIGKLLLVRHVE